jgi:hypothetical protein
MDTPPVNCIGTLILTVEGSIALESRNVKSAGRCVAVSDNVTKLTVCGLFRWLSGWARVLITLNAIAW